MWSMTWRGLSVRLYLVRCRRHGLRHGRHRAAARDVLRVFHRSRHPRERPASNFLQGVRMLSISRDGETGVPADHNPTSHNHSARGSTLVGELTPPC